MRLLHPRHDHDDGGADEEQKADLPRALKGSVCRCTGYGSIATRSLVPHASSLNDSGSSPVGQGLGAPAGRAVVTGAARFTCDLAPEVASDAGPDGNLPPGPPLHLKLVRAPHAHAWIRSIDVAAALRVPGVVTVLSYQDSPATRFSTARHANPDEDPYDTLVFDRTVRFHGQRVAAVVAETVAAAEAGCALVTVDYEVRPAVTDPAAALAPGAPPLHPVSRRATCAPRCTACPAIPRRGSRRPTWCTRGPSARSGSSMSR